MAGVISFTGLASGMDTASWVDALVEIKNQAVTKLETKKTVAETKQKSLSTVQSSFVNLRSSIEKLTDAKFGSSFDLFAKNKAKSSDEGVLTASVTADAVKQSVNVSVQQLATSTVVKADAVGAFITGNEKFTSIANGEAKAGDFNMYVDGERFTINIDEEDTINDVLQKITDETGLEASVVDGKINISNFDENDVEHTLTVGSNLDTSNFAGVMNLYAKEDGSYESYNKVSKINLSGTLLDGKAGFTDQVKASRFKIGDQEFTVDSSTTMNSLISKINSNKDANVSASWDSSEGKLILTSKTEGAFNINVENLEGNFTDIIGLTTTTYDEDGAVETSRLKSGTQTLGNFAKLTINGTSMISSSNTVTSDISGLKGVTMNLKSISKEDADDVTVNIEQDTSELVSAVKDFVKNFNTMLSQVDTATSSAGDLYGETALTMTRNSLRTGVMTADKTVASDSKYKMLASIGISTGTIGSDISKSTDQLVFDEKKFLDALKDDPNAVKKLLVGDTSANGATSGGILTKIENIVEGATNTTTGYFAKRNASYSQEISRLKTDLATQTRRISDYRASLEKQFRAMEDTISKMNKQYSNFLGG